LPPSGAVFVADAAVAVAACWLLLAAAKEGKAEQQQEH